MKTLAIVQARMRSARLPKKVMRTIGGVPVIELLLNRLKKAKQISHIVVATTDHVSDESLAAHVQSLGHEVFFGSEKDVLGRYHAAAKKHQPDIVVRITGDCPLVDAELVDQIISYYKNENVDYLSNNIHPTYPDGLDTEVFSFLALEKAAQQAESAYEREHVTPYIRESGFFKVKSFNCDQDLSQNRWTLDEPADFEVIANVFNHFSPRIDFSWQEVLELQSTQPELFKANQHISRNEGAKIGSGQKLWKRAKHVIPGGNMLLSKRAEMFLPNLWPAYFSKAKGCRVWDLDGNEFIDMSIMGIGTNILGYGHPEVDNAVRKAIEFGNMSTFNCPEEVLLAEKLIELHPWADMVRLARTGGEANALAIRIARASSGRDKVAFCGYHGWHDWYLAANLSDDENLNGHLLPGLAPKGVPQNLEQTIFPFSYNNYSELEDLVNRYDIGVIKMEVMRNSAPKNDFLLKVRKLATDRRIVLIFDECTSGFRQTFGGLHKYFGVEPDMAMFGKALGNGYAITATIGRREIMEAAQSTFISSTFWTERIGPTAGLATLDAMARTQAWEKVSALGESVRQGWKMLAQKYGVSITTTGLSALASFSFSSPNALAYKTLITQEMLKKGFLASTSFYACTEHSPELISQFLETLDPIFSKIQKCEDGLDIFGLLDGPVCHEGFKRLN